MVYTYLNNINSPADLKRLPICALPTVCAELRDFIIKELSHNPGHLASSLGAIEITVALHYVFDTPNDLLIWDVGHQAYAHKILTGRRNEFHTNRQFKGLAPFPSPKESPYDAFVAGHASNSISAALGEQIAAQLQGNEKNVVAIIGDGSMTGGLAFEGLNNTSMFKNNLLIILNDNNMAIDPIKGGFTQYLVDITTTHRYNWFRNELYKLAKSLHLITEADKHKVQRRHNNLKAILTNQSHNIFQGLNLRYFGPTDGHNVEELVRILSEIKHHTGPKVLHIITKKGKGYAPAEENQTIWHAPGEFNASTGERLADGVKGHAALWQEVFGNTLLNLARKNKRIVGITPAMPSGCSMCIMQRELPDRVFDVGIAEGHAVTFAAGLAKEGMIPYCNIYSSFMQRAYDNIVHDVALLGLHVVLCIDRAGIVGADGATHHGLFDMAYLRPIPNLIIGAPMTAEDLEDMLSMAQHIEAPIAIRYPRGRSITDNMHRPVETYKSIQLRTGSKGVVLSIGSIGNVVEDALKEIEGVAHYNMRWLKPLDTNVLDYVGTHYDRILTVEDGVRNGGLGSAIAEYCAEKGYPVQVERLGVDDCFVEHGSTQELFHMLGLDAEGIKKSVNKLIGNKPE